MWKKPNCFSFFIPLMPLWKLLLIKSNNLGLVEVFPEQIIEFGFCGRPVIIHYQQGTKGLSDQRKIKMYSIWLNLSKTSIKGHCFIDRPWLSIVNDQGCQWIPVLSSHKKFCLTIPTKCQTSTFLEDHFKLVDKNKLHDYLNPYLNINPIWKLIQNWSSYLLKIWQL